MYIYSGKFRTVFPIFAYLFIYSISFIPQTSFYTLYSLRKEMRKIGHCADFSVKPQISRSFLGMNSHIVRSIFPTVYKNLTSNLQQIRYTASNGIWKRCSPKDSGLQDKLKEQLQRPRIRGKILSF
jgi:hypothetical protein